MELIGKGSFGNVYCCIKNGIKYANKKISLYNVLRNNLFFEIDFMCRLNNPYLMHINILEIYDRNISLYIDLGIDLSHFLKKIDILPITNYNVILRLLYQVGLGLNYLHTLDLPCYHADIKQENIIVYGSIDNIKTLKCKLSDFSLSGTIMHKGEFGGTLGYSSPETYIGKKKDYLKSDIWSYGVLILKSLTGYYLINIIKDDKQEEYSKIILLLFTENRLKKKLSEILL